MVHHRPQSIRFRRSRDPELRSTGSPLAAVLGVDLLLRVNEELLEDRDVSLRFDRPEVLLCPDAIIVDLSNDDTRATTRSPVCDQARNCLLLARLLRERQ